MPFDLFITSTQGRTVKSLRSPYPDRNATRRTITAVAGDKDIPPEETRAFADRVIAAPLGESVVHPVHGVTFRTEEV